MRQKYSFYLHSPRPSPRNWSSSDRSRDTTNCLSAQSEQCPNSRLAALQTHGRGQSVGTGHNPEKTLMHRRLGYRPLPHFAPYLSKRSDYLGGLEYSAPLHKLQHPYKLALQVHQVMVDRLSFQKGQWPYS